MDVEHSGADDDDDDDALPLQDFEACSLVEIQLGGQAVVVYCSASQQCEWTMHQAGFAQTCSFLITV